MSRRLSARFFARPVAVVAPELLGCVLVHVLDGGARLSGRIVEVEAYLGDGTDPSSHAHGGPSPRNAAMFGPPGRFYVYRSMGIHACVNLVCEARGSGAAVLLRAVEPLEGVALMQRRRGGRTGPALTNGPGKLAQAFGIGLEDDGRPALRGALRVEPAREPPRRIARSPRIGLGKGVHLRLRYFDPDSAWVTPSRFNRRARARRGAQGAGAQGAGTRIRL